MKTLKTTAMKNNDYNRIMVGMDLTGFDQRILDYLKEQAGILMPESVYFLHVSPSLDMPVFMMDNFGIREEVPVDEQVEINMEGIIEPIFGNFNFDRQYDVQEGGVTKQLLHWIKVKRIDLAILGRRGPHFNHALSARRFVRRADCDVLFVPDRDLPPLKRIVVGVDFSSNSQWALQKAAALAKRNGGDTAVEVLHVYDIPQTLHSRIGRTEDQFDQYFRDNLKDFLDRFLKEEPSLEGLEVRQVLLERGDTTLAHEIVKYVENNGSDLLVMGAKGHNDLDVFFLGSFTEQVLGLTKELPLLVVKTPAAEASESQLQESSRKSSQG